MKAWKLEDMPEHVKRQVLNQVEKPALRPQGDPIQPKAVSEDVPKAKRRTEARKGPNKTEQRFKQEKLHGKEVWFEGVTFRLHNGHAYTPDFTYWVGPVLHCVEVKGSHKFFSEGRAKFAFDQAVQELPNVVFEWWRYTGKGWIQEF